MAKSSRSPKATEGNMVQFIVETMENANIARGMEPANHIPCVDMYSTDREIAVEIEMPGVRRQDIEVTLFKNTLSIKALKYECFDETNINYVCMERSFGRLFRTIELPFPVASDKIKAAYKNGILRIVLPRVDEKRGRPKEIKIETQ